MPRSTVLIVTPEQTRALEVDSRWLRWLRPALLSLAVSTLVCGVGLVGTGIYAWSERVQRSDQVALLQQHVNDLSNATSEELSAKLAEVNTRLAALRKSEQMVADVAQYLQARGVNVKSVSIEPRSGQPNPAAGGALPGGASVRPGSGSFANHTQNLLQALQSTPLGMPHLGALTSGFGARANPFTGQGSETHPGLDFKGDTGEPIRSTARGRVLVAARQGGYGNMVQIEHAHGYVTAYAHLSRIDVKPGQWLEAGDVVGALGSTGRSTGPHLHYEVLRGGERQDPEGFLRLGQQGVAAR